MPRMPHALADAGTDPVDIWVGRAIRDRRNAMEATQSQLAQALGVTFQQVQKYERGTNRVSASMLFRAAAFLGCQPGDLFPSVATPGDPADTAQLLDTHLGRQLVADAAALPNWARAVLAAFATGLRGQVARASAVATFIETGQGAA